MQDKHLKTNIGQYAVIIKDKKVLMLCPPNGPLWIYPGGRINEKDTDYKEALKREIYEELNLNINILEPIDVQMWSTNDNDHRYGVFFLCELIDNIKKIRLSKEHSKHEWFSYEELIEHYSKEPIRAKPGITVANKLREKNII
ncbi:MAG: NUDIX hydrolase [Candidatus Woesearchaeota archaeon]|jgi:8-oxo-dGTP pyrophosphatase MutT (NUDIX family)